MADDTLTLTIRLHDPKEKSDSRKSAIWATIKLPRTDLDLPMDDLIERHVLPAVKQVVQTKLI